MYHQHLAYKRHNVWCACLVQVPASLPAPGAHEPTAKSGTHAYKQDPRNEDILIGIRDGVTGRFDLVRGL